MYHVRITTYFHARLQDSCADIHSIVLNGLGAFQPSARDVVKDVAVPRLLPTAEQLSHRLCALRQFHPRKVCISLSWKHVSYFGLNDNFFCLCFCCGETLIPA